MVALALLAVWRARDRRVWLLAGVVLFSLLMALGPHGFLYNPLKAWVPLFGFIRFPVKFLVLATFAIPLLAAHGLGWLLALPAGSGTPRWRSLGGLALLLVGVMAVIIWAAWTSVPGPQLSVVAGNAGVRALFLAALVLGLARLSAEPDPRRQRVLQIGLLLALWFDIFTHCCNLSPTVPAAALDPDAVRRSFNWDSQLRPGGSRAMESKAALWRMLSTGAPNLQADLAARRLSLFMNLNLLDDVPKFDGFYSMDLEDFLQVFKHVYFTTNDAKNFQNFLGVSHTSNPTNALEWVTRGSFLPLVTAGQRPVFAEAPETLQTMLGTNFEPARVVYLPPEAKAELHGAGPAEVRLGPVRFSAGRLEFEAEAAGPAMVVVAQAFYHWWRPYVDGKPVPLLRANYAFQALEIPAGKHDVTLVYKDRAFSWGIFISLASLIGCGAGWFAWRRAEKERG